MPKSYKTVEIEQQCQFGFTEDKLKEFLQWTSIKDYAYIKHDKCMKANGEPKEDHIHCMLRFKDSVPTGAILAKCKAVFGADVIKEEQLEKCKRWVSAVAYLTHENVQGKHVYPREEVVSNYEFQNDIEMALTDAKRRDNLLAKIDSGECREYNIYDYCTIHEYANWKNKIDSAFAYRAKKLMNNGDRNMKCVYIQGDSGVGKTSLAKEICEDKEYSYFVSSGSNDVLDGYGGQDAIILDDLRPSCLNLSDLLKMLDNNTSSSVKSRYRNKVLECRLIVITTTLDISTFFKQVFSEQPETAKQLRRRCETYIILTLDTMKTGVYDKFHDNYIWAPVIPNPIAVKYGLSNERSIDILADSLNEMLGSIPGMQASLKAMKEKAKKDDDYIQEELPWND